MPGELQASVEVLVDPEIPAVNATFRFVYPPIPQLVAEARRRVAGICREHGFDSYGPVLAASELLTNAMKFAARPGDGSVLTVQVTASHLLVEVSDGNILTGPNLDRLARPGGEEENGRGLLLVREIADGLEVRLDGFIGRKVFSARFERAEQ